MSASEYVELDSKELSLRIAEIREYEEHTHKAKLVVLVLLILYLIWLILSYGTGSPIPFGPGV